MRSCLFLCTLVGAFLLQPTVSSAQGGFSRGGARPSAAVAPEFAVPVPALQNTAGQVVSRDTKLTAGDIITIQVKEDGDLPLRTAVTDTGEVELNGLGRVFIAGKTSAEAQLAIESFLKQKYYHRATVEVGVITKVPGLIRPFKVLIMGKVGRPGPQYFTPANPLKLTEAVVVAGKDLYSDLDKVRLTRGGRSTEHNINSIIKQGRPDLDVTLQDGDQIFVPAAWLRFKSE